MRAVKVQGNNAKHRVLMYAISTCGWCKKAKRTLNELDVAYEYIDVDLLGDEEKQVIIKDILDRGGRLVYPTLIIDNTTLLAGPSRSKLVEVLEL